MCSCSSKKHRYLPHRRDFSKTQSLWKFQLNFMHFFKFFGLTDPPPPREIPKPSLGEGGGVVMDIFWKFYNTETLCYKQSLKQLQKEIPHYSAHRVNLY